MEGFGHDVAQKIKFAIRAKLVELDAYVDDELPDYIMVMVANKKSKASMAEDLNLFLNEHTEHFTDWLHDVLNKLHSVSLEGNKGRRRSSVSTSDVKTVEKVEQETVSTSQTLLIEEEVNASDVKPKDETGSVVVVAEPVVPDVVEAPPADSDPQDDFLAIKAEPEKDDILGEELKEESVVPQPASSIAEQTKSQSTINVTKAEIPETQSSVAPDKPPIHVATSSSIVPRLIRLTRISHPDTKESTSNGVTVQPKAPVKPKQKLETSDFARSSSPPTRKRKIPTSTLGAVVQRPFPQPDDDEDEYDPRHPTIGTVASVVHVSQRKINVPPERQASKTLLLKAIDEARKSVLRSTKPSQGIYVNNESATQLFTKTYLSTMEQRGDDSISSKIRRRPLRQLSPPLTSISSGTRAMKGTKPNLRQSKTEPESPLKKPAPATKVVAPMTDVVAPASPVSRHVPITIDEQILSATEMKVELDEGDEVEELLDYSSEEPMECAIVPQNIVRPASPRFIITLDGVDAENMFPGYDNSMVDPSDEALDLSAEGELESELQRQQQTQPNTPTNSNGMSINSRIQSRVTSLIEDEMEYEDDEETENLTAKRAKVDVSDRCRYWPACRNGDDCPYLHPSIPCKTFPNCKYGCHCVYVHPPCKYDSVCSRRDCQYAHTQQTSTPIAVSVAPVRRPFARMTVGSAPLGRVSVSAAQAPSHPAVKTRCRDFPKCTNMSCPFLHPKLCRYGVGCVRADCIFSHPPLPKRDQLKWSNRHESPTGELQQQPINHRTNHVSRREIRVIKVEL